jgi:hypothetical protein
MNHAITIEPPITHSIRIPFILDSYSVEMIGIPYEIEYSIREVDKELAKKDPAQYDKNHRYFFITTMINTIKGKIDVTLEINSIIEDQGNCRLYFKAFKPIIFEDKKGVQDEIISAFPLFFRARRFSSPKQKLLIWTMTYISQLMRADGTLSRLHERDNIPNAFIGEL